MKDVLKLAEQSIKDLMHALAEGRVTGDDYQPEEIEAFSVLDSIREALAQPEQEPVAWGFRHHDGAIYDCISPEAHADCEGEYNVPLYDAPPKRPWVGLTDELGADGDPMFYCGAKWAEAKLKELNT